MHYYPHHIGDFVRATARLTDSQAMTYLRLMWLYYDKEQPLVNDMALLSAHVGSDHETIRLMLSMYFKLDDQGFWRNKRCDETIKKYKDELEKRSKAGIASAESKKKKLKALVEQVNNISSTHVKHMLNTSTADVQDMNNTSSAGVQLTKNQEPRTKNQIKEEIYISDVKKPDDVSEQLWSDFLRVRETKRNRLTQTAFTALRSEAQKAGMTLEEVLLYIVPKGWSSFEVEYLKGFVPKEEPRKRAI